MRNVYINAVMSDGYYKEIATFYYHDARVINVYYLSHKYFFCKTLYVYIYLYTVTLYTIIYFIRSS